MSQSYYYGAQYVPGAGLGAAPQNRSFNLEYIPNYPPSRTDIYRGGSDIQKRMTQREDTLRFEQGRIKALQEERLHIQKKTFTKWINSFLLKYNDEYERLRLLWLRISTDTIMEERVNELLTI